MGVELSVPLPQQQPQPQEEEQKQGQQEQQQKVIFERYVEPEGTKIEVEPTEVALSDDIVKKKEKTKLSNKTKTQ
jgi:hypothetical protein